MAIIWFDTEFIDDGKTIELLSVGLVNDRGTVYYAEPAETDRSRAGGWVRANVIPHLTGPILPRQTIAQDIVEFVGPSPEFWAWYGAYDWVALCQLYGTMMDLPKDWPMFYRDYRQVMTPAQMPRHKGVEHNALDDALWLRRAYLEHAEARSRNQ